MRKIFTFLMCVMFASVAFGQLPTDVIMKTDTKPVIDGVLDDGIWDVATVNAIDKPFTGETPTLGNPGETNWRALWDNDGIYVFITVTDDVYMPVYDHTGNSYEYDHAEIYFDTNYILEDGLGPQTDGNGNGNGHYQFADNISTGIDDGTMQTRSDGVQYAMLNDGTNYTEEYFIPFTKLITGAGGMMDKTQEIGFDVCIIDDDVADTPDSPVRNRAVWSNDGSITSENWVDMDQAGRITLDGAEPGIFVDAITISVDGDITQDNQTLQINAVITPEDATDKTVKYKILDGSTARASISKTGLITPITNGVLIVGATDATDYVDWDANAITINISGQKTTRFEVSYIKNGDFNVVDTSDTGEIIPGAPWSGGSTVVDGVLNITNTNGQGVNPWDWTVGQNVNIPAELKNDPFVLQLKMWISEPDTFDVDLELIGDDYLRFGNTTDPHSADGRSQWRFELTTEPTMYTIDITDFSGMDDRDQKFNLFAGLTNNTVYIDSVTLVSVADLENVVWTSAPERAMQAFKVYPNPASSKLNIDLPTANTKVTIYNSVGIMMEETVVPGTHHVFDVSNYNKGLYFIKANDTVVKFIR